MVGMVHSLANTGGGSQCVRWPWYIRHVALLAQRGWRLALLHRFDVLFARIKVQQPVIEHTPRNRGRIFGTKAGVFDDDGERNFGIIGRGKRREQGMVTQALLCSGSHVFFVLFDLNDLRGAGLAAAGVGCAAKAGG